MLERDLMAQIKDTASGLWLLQALVLVAAVSFTAACEHASVPDDDLWWSVEDPAATLSPNALVFTHETLLADLDAPRHASDGGGRAWLAHPAKNADGSNPEIA
jgi:hypothetical protein